MNKLFFAILGISFFATSNTSNACNITNPDVVVAINNQKICNGESAPVLKGLSTKQGETAVWSTPAEAINTVTASGQIVNLKIGVNRFIYTITSSTEAAPCIIDTALVTIIVEQEPDFPLAGLSTIVCDSNYKMQANYISNGVGTWSPIGSVTPINSPNGTAILKKNQANIFSWTVSNGVGTVCPDKTSSVTIYSMGDITSAEAVSSQSKTIYINYPAPLLSTNGILLKQSEIGIWSAVAPASISSNGQTSDLALGYNIFYYTITTIPSVCPPSIGIVVINVIDVTGIEEIESLHNNKKLIRILTPLGQELQPEQATEGLFIYKYSDGSTMKVMKQN